MRSLLRAEDYTSPEIFAAEQSQIFRRLWILVGLRTLLREHDAYLTRSIGGVPIVVQNCGGTLRGYVNQCAHRQSPLQIGDYGVRRLACRYHGWVYDHEGRVKAIPGRDSLYGFSAEAIGTLRLAPIAVRVVGELVFVNLAADPPAIDQQFHAKYLKRLGEISSYFDDQVIVSKVKGRYNWKLNFENVIDFNHVPYVHSTTFASMIPGLRQFAAAPALISSPPVPDSDVGDDIRDLSYEVSVPVQFRRWPWHEQVDRFTLEDSYFNFFVYPNVNFFSLGGLILAIQQFNPLSEIETELTHTITTGRQRERIPATPAILWGQVKGEANVADEDVVLLDALQHGLHRGGRSALHGAYESRLRSIAKVYRRLMAEEPA